ncbi:hypothetical protein ABIE67_006269 [Streptomyces sp. V4I8]|uniref:hypothetical protein n=1 Tax=Streptomyces sp. V4I8 TaxID=3156469 RepID=UPI003515C5BB
MDAGFAAVLGAAVGAIGTGGAGITAALLARSQTKLQLRAEHVRMIREPRKVTYVAYTEVARKLHDFMSEAVSKFYGMASHSHGITEDEVSEVRALYDQVVATQSEFDHTQAQIYVEGPPSVRKAAITLGSKLSDFRGGIFDRLCDLERRQIVPAIEQVDALKEARSAAHRAYLDFLYSASEAIGADGVGTPIE